MTSQPSLVAAALTLAVVLVVAAGLTPALLAPGRSIRAVGRRRSRYRWPARPRRAPQPDEVSVAAWCDRVAGGVRGGSSLTQAVVDAGHEPGAPFEHVVHAVQRGRPLAAAFQADVGDPTTAVGLTAPVMATCAELGGPAAPALERLAGVLLARSAERDERRTASAQARLSAQVLTLVPVGVVALLVATEPSIRDVVATPAGATSLVAGTALDVAGWWWMGRMIGPDR